MGLNRASARGALVTAALLAAAAGAAIVAPPRAPVDTITPGRAMLWFAADGAQGPITGTVTVEADRIVDVTITRSSEGIDRRALADDAVGARLRGLPATPPLDADAISGATVSSRRVIDAIERRLLRWQAARRAR